MTTAIIIALCVAVLGLLFLNRRLAWQVDDHEERIGDLELDIDTKLDEYP